MIDRLDLACYAKCSTCRICAPADVVILAYFESRRTEPTATRSEARSAAWRPCAGFNKLYPGGASDHRQQDYLSSNDTGGYDGAPGDFWYMKAKRSQ